MRHDDGVSVGIVLWVEDALAVLVQYSPLCSILFCYLKCNSCMKYPLLYKANKYYITTVVCVRPVIDWQYAQGVPSLSPKDSWAQLQLAPRP